MTTPSEKAMELADDLYDEITTIIEDMMSVNGQRYRDRSKRMFARVIDKIIAEAKDHK